MLFGRSGYVEMISITIFSYVGYLLVYIFAPFMVVSTMCEETRPIYEDVYMVRGTSRIFLPNIDVVAQS
jgi:hypothetical protein